MMTAVSFKVGFGVFALVVFVTWLAMAFFDWPKG